MGHSCDRDFSKPQKFHAVPVPRIGGIGIMLGLLAAAAGMASVMAPESSVVGLLLLACALPAFLSGVIQDLTEAVTPRGRLIATACSAILAFFLMNAAITRTGIPGVDWFVTFTAGSLFITILAVSGIANAVNIIDGFNGLASMCIALMLTALAFVAFKVDDPLIGSLAMGGIGAVLGFFVWNFPSGKIFLGDGGAYFLGFFVSELSILLLQRNPGEISPLFPLLVCIYPVFETLFSVYRRCWLRDKPPLGPDGIHLHSLIYRRVLRWTVGHRDDRSVILGNSLTSPYLWVLCMLSVIPATLFFGNSLLLTIFIVGFGAGYVFLYWRIVRFRSPRWLRFAASRPGILIDSHNRQT